MMPALSILARAATRLEQTPASPLSIQPIAATFLDQPKQRRGGFASTVLDRNSLLNPATVPTCMSSARTWSHNRYRYLVAFNPDIPPPGTPHPRRTRAPP